MAHSWIRKGIVLLWPGIISVTAVSAQEYGFEKGYEGWNATGKVRIVGRNAYKGGRCAEITGYGSLQRRFATSPLSIVEYKAYIRTSGGETKGYSSISFFDSTGKKLLRYEGNTASGAGYQSTGCYTETPPGTRYLEIMIGKDSTGSGSIDIDDISVNANVEGAARHKPACDLKQYMLPFWRSDTIFNETVLLLSENGQPACGRLLFHPAKILSVKSYDLKTAYSEGTDYIIKDNIITRSAHSAMPFRADTSFDHHDLAWYNIQSQWVVVTYTHTDRWKGPKPSYKGNLLPRTAARLAAKAPLTVVAYGMSITRGMDVSGYDKVPPYMPTYASLFVRRLEELYDDPRITLYNAGLPGAMAEWGAEHAGDYVNPLHPDLVIIDFGMNDFWTVSPQQFGNYIATIMRKVKAANPHAEFMLLSNLLFDPAYVSDTDRNRAKYINNMKGYNATLQGMETAGVADLDMTTLSGAVYRLKKAKDCIVNPMHPNDYMARWYAQGMVALLDKTSR